jgi:hypothetical protein
LAQRAGGGGVVATTLAFGVALGVLGGGAGDAPQ